VAVEAWLLLSPGKGTTVIAVSTELRSVSASGVSTEGGRVKRHGKRACASSAG
jgi:hypothetical protein